jgi:fumarate hydratase class II
MVCAQVVGNDAAITIGGMNGHFQLNVFKPVMIYNFLQAANNLADACAGFAEHCVAGIEPNLPVIQKNLNNSLMLVTALNPHVGYDNAARIAKKAHEEGSTLKEAALALGLVSSDDFDTWVDPSKMV